MGTKTPKSKQKSLLRGKSLQQQVAAQKKDRT